MKILIILKKQHDSVTRFTEKKVMNLLNLLGFKFGLFLKTGGTL